VIESSPIQGDIREIEPGLYSVLIAGRSYEVRIDPASALSAGAEPAARPGTNEPAPDYYAHVRGRRYAVQVRDPRRLPLQRGRAAAAGRQSVASPMPGKVVRLLVSEGEQVKAGQGLLVVEAMKMQNEIRAPKDGRVTAIRVAEGAAVAGGETLAEVE
jgi:biotin carboxyl carrier protein